MDKFFEVDWKTLFAPDVPLLETFLRGTIIYLVLFALLRFVLQRQAGTVGITDLLVVVLIADAAQNAMASDYKSITDGVLLVSTIVFWCYALDWLGYHFPFVERIVRPAPLPLVKDGQLLRKNMRRELITMDELMSMLREQGIDDLSKVKRAFMEGDGHISVVENKEKQHEAPKRQIS